MKLKENRSLNVEKSGYRKRKEYRSNGDCLRTGRKGAEETLKIKEEKRKRREALKEGKNYRSRKKDLLEKWSRNDKKERWKRILK